mmetsp:Transcript_27756/g.43714  ORF Transcript_27756/g.43714 Transcript_27756/m.43714 type:complete len:222 (+) Transcript_27756:1046-1711(+)
MIWMASCPKTSMLGRKSTPMESSKLCGSLFQCMGGKRFLLAQIKKSICGQAWIKQKNLPAPATALMSAIFIPRNLCSDSSRMSYSTTVKTGKSPSSTRPPWLPSRRRRRSRPPPPPPMARGRARRPPPPPPPSPRRPPRSRTCPPFPPRAGPRAPPPRLPSTLKKKSVMKKQMALIWKQTGPRYGMFCTQNTSGIGNGPRAGYMKGHTAGLVLKSTKRLNS